MISLLDEDIAPSATLYHPTPQQPSEMLGGAAFCRPSLSQEFQATSVFLLAPDGTPLVTPLAAYVGSAINALLRLPRAWDGMRAQTVTQEAASAAIAEVFAIANDRSVPPQFFPLPDGGIQLEWCVAGRDLEIEIDAAGSTAVLATDANGETVLEGTYSLHDGAFTQRLRGVVDWLSRMAAEPSWCYGIAT